MFAAVFSKATHWNIVPGHAYRVGLGLPAGFAVLTSARLVVLDATGREISGRDVVRGEIDPRVRAGEG